MKNKMGDKQRILHILAAIEEIESYTANSTIEQFISDSMMRFATVKQIEIIGEACNRISPATKKAFVNVDWITIITMRNILIHEYFGIDNNLVWQVVSTDLPLLKEKIKDILDQLE